MCPLYLFQESILHERLRMTNNKLNEIVIKIGISCHEAHTKELQQIILVFSVSPRRIQAVFELSR